VNAQSGPGPWTILQELPGRCFFDACASVYTKWLLLKDMRREADVRVKKEDSFFSLISGRREAENKGR
jgi:hypothetical protein